MLHSWKYRYFLLICSLYLTSPTSADNEEPVDEGVEACKTLPLIRLTEYRFLSTVRMSWTNAKACCEQRNMILHTPERADDGEEKSLAKALLSSNKLLGDSEAPFWSSGYANPSSTNEEDTFLWQFKTPAGKKSLMYYKFMRERHFWEEDEPSDNLQDYCLAIKEAVSQAFVHEEFVGIYARKCSEERHFVCQDTDILRSGKALKQRDREFCESLQKSDFQELKRVKGLYVNINKKVSWQTAKYCCEKVNMTLAGRFTHNVSIEALDDLEEIKSLSRDINHHGFWVGLSAFCNKTWVWPCGELDDLKKGWSYHKEKLIQERGTSTDEYDVRTPDNYLENEYCGEVGYRKDNILEGDGESDGKTVETAWKLQKNDLDCNVARHFICQDNLKCSKGEKFKCTEPPKVIDIDKSVPEDMMTCRNMSFELLGNSSEFEYYISTRATFSGLDQRDYDVQLTWKGSMLCLRELKLTPASFQSEEDKEFFQTYLSAADRFTQEKLLWIPSLTSSSSKSGKPEPLMWWNFETFTLTSTPVPTEDVITFTNVENIVPLCGALGYSQGKVGVLAINCLERHFTVYVKKVENKVPENETIVEPPIIDIGDNNTIVDPLATANRTNNQSLPCVDRNLALLLPSVCPNMSTTISRPTARQLQSNKDSTSAENLHKLRYQNRKLKETVIDIAVTGTIYYAHNPRNSFRLAGLVAGVYMTQCPEVPRYFIEDVLHYLHKTHFFTSRGRDEFFNQDEFVWMKKLMHQCINESRLLSFRTDECGELIYSEGSCGNFICADPEFQFNITRFDPIMEAWWKMYELAHAVCFEFFEESYRMFHLYAQSFLDTYSEGLRLRKDHQIQTNKFWERVLGPEYELYLLNMDRCNEAVIRNASLPYRQHISTLPNRVRLHGAKIGATAANNA